MGTESTKAEQRTAALNFRVTPSLKAKIEAAAEASGNTVSRECELRLLNSVQGVLAGDDDTSALLSAIAEQIQALEAETGKKWRDDPKTWSAVRTMLYWGPIVAMRKVDQDDLRQLQRLQAEREDTQEEANAIRTLVYRHFGIKVDRDPSERINALLAFKARGEEAAEGREYLRIQLDELDLNEEGREVAKQLVSELEARDRELKRIDGEIAQLVEALRVAVTEGETLPLLTAPDPLIREARRQTNRIAQASRPRIGSLGALFSNRKADDNAG